MTEPDFRHPGAPSEADGSGPRDESVTGAGARVTDPTEGMAAADGLTSSPEVAERYRDMSETGATVRGEGELP